MPKNLRINSVLLCFVLIGLCYASEGNLFAQTAAMRGELFTVNSVADTHDAQTGDGICADASNNCTLRAAIEEANTTVARDAILFSTPQPSTINLTLGELVVSRSVDIVGPGARRLTVQRSASAANFRIFRIGPTPVVFNLYGMTIRNGVASSGGAILGETNVVMGLYDSALIGNTATNGGAIALNDSMITILRSLISSNTATGSGGGIYITGAGSSVPITCSTFTGNSAATGGAIYNEGALVLINATISQNAASTAASSIFSNPSGNIRVLNTIIGRDVGQSITALSGAFTSVGNNIVTDARSSTGFVNDVNNDQVSDNNVIDPLLGPLANNSGQSDTMAVLANSPAINKGNPCVVIGNCFQILPGVLVRGSVDQRRVPRSFLFDSNPEIGAFEQGDPPFFVRYGTLGIFNVGSFMTRFTGSPVILTNTRTLEKRFARLNMSGQATFREVRMDDDYVIEFKAKRQGLFTPSVIQFE